MFSSSIVTEGDQVLLVVGVLSVVSLRVGVHCHLEVSILPFNPINLTSRVVTSIQVFASLATDREVMSLREWCLLDVSRLICALTMWAHAQSLLAAASIVKSCLICTVSHPCLRRTQSALSNHLQLITKSLQTVVLHAHAVI